jgi:hypothetical protein
MAGPRARPIEVDMSNDHHDPRHKVARLISLLSAHEQLVVDLRLEIAILSGQDQQSMLESVRAKNIARALLGFRRRMRIEYVGRMGDHFLQDPALDVMLEAFSRHVEGRPVSLTTLHNKDESSQTTALRWGSKLVDAGLAARTRDHLDHRREWFLLDAGLCHNLTGLLNQLCVD